MSCHGLCHAIGTHGDAGGLCESELGYQHPGDRHRIPEHPGVAIGLWKLVHATRCRCGRKSGGAGANRGGLALRQHGPGWAGDSDEEHAFKVVGLLAPKGQSTQGQDQDDIIFMPYTTAQKKLIGITHIHSILASAVSNDMMAEAVEQITALLRQRHRLLPWQENDFSIRRWPTWRLPKKKAHVTMTLLLGSIASISLLVGGIGIMNIMLVSVTERTREIGIRMAVGAKKRDILWQFLVEAMMLSFIGGLVGIGLGVSGSKLISSLRRGRH